ncbi:MAG: hypothetical protein ACRC2T_15975 [Thermoguttaceae bacterium]
MAGMTLGTMLTASIAKGLGRKVFAMRGDDTTESFGGCRLLLKEGAILADSAETIITEIGNVMHI